MSLKYSAACPMDQPKSNILQVFCDPSIRSLKFTPTVSKLAMSFLLGLFMLLLYYHLKARLQYRGKKLPPGSFGLPLVGESLYFVYYVWRDRFFLFTRLRRAKYGDVFKSYIFGSPYVIVCGAKAGRMMTVLEHKTFQAHQFASAHHLLGPRSVFTAHGEPHKRFRSLTNEAFSAEALKGGLHKIEHMALDVLSSWKVGDVIVVADETTKFTFSIIAAMVMGWMPGPLTEKASLVFRDVIYGLIRPPINIPGFAFHKAMKARAELVEMFDHEIEQRKLNTEEVKDDILQSMLDACDDQGNNLSRQEITDNLISFLLAGHETSASTIAFIVQFLEDEPHVLEQLRDEHEAIHQAKATPNAPLTWADYKKMTFTDKVISEASRKASIAPWWHRFVAQDFEFEGYQIPKGWSIIFYLEGMHQSAKYYPDPDTFKPSRFDEPPKPYTFMAWGGGTRMCLGMNLAKMEIAIFLHHLLLKYMWKATQPNLGVEYFGLPKPKGGVPIFIKEKVM